MDVLPIPLALMRAIGIRSPDEINYLLDQLVTSEEGSWWQRWRFSRDARLKVRQWIH